jgi:hypothetical protein
VLFLSDGASSWDSDDAAWAQANLAALGQAHLITYALGSGAATSVLKSMACDNNGILYTVGDDANLGARLRWRSIGLGS